MFLPGQFAEADRAYQDELAGVGELALLHNRPDEATALLRHAPGGDRAG